MSSCILSHKNRRVWSAIAWPGLLLASLILRFYRGGGSPFGMDYDQVREAYLASKLFQDFHVIVDNLMFLHLASLRLVQLVFGLGELSIHIHAACWFTLTLLPLYWLTSDLFGNIVARWGVLFLSFSVIGFTAPRVGHIPTLVPFFAFSALLAGERLLRTGRYGYAALLGGMLGLGVFTFPTFKSVFLVLIGASLSIAWLARSTTMSWKSWKQQVRFGRIGWSVVITAGVFLGVICWISFGLTGEPARLQSLKFIIFHYKSNGKFVSDLGHFLRNGLQIASQILPVRYLAHPHYLIPRNTGYANALFYLSPLVGALVVAAFLAGTRIIRRLSQKCPFSQAALSLSDSRNPPSEPLVSSAGLLVFWRKEYNWLFALWILGGGCVFAMLSDHTAARRWVYSWFWMYPLAAAAIFWGTRKYSRMLTGALLGLTLLSQVALVYYPYLCKPWRMQGPGPAVIDTMNEYCKRDYRVYATHILHHWTRHYQQIVPLRNCGYDVVYGPVSEAQLTAPYAVFDIGDLYRPQRFNHPAPTMRFDDPPRGVAITKFRDKWGFYDFKVTESLPPSKTQNQ